jgi:hypothetical protein
MSASICDQVRAAALDPGAVPADWARRPEVAAHVRRCPSCQDWLDAFAAGERAWAAVPAAGFTERVVARTSELETILGELPWLAEMDPGPDFAERVLLATSMKPVPAGWRDRMADAWSALVRRPRFAWEAAYVATVCWVLVFGNPVGAIEWSAANIGAVARERLATPVQDLRADLEGWRTRLSPDSAPAPGSSSERQVEAASPAVRVWRAAVEWLRRASSSVIDAIAQTWDAIAAWLGGPEDEPAPRTTEPPRVPARSRQ